MGILSIIKNKKYDFRYTMLSYAIIESELKLDNILDLLGNNIAIKDGIELQIFIKAGLIKDKDITNLDTGNISNMLMNNKEFLDYIKDMDIKCVLEDATKSFIDSFKCDVSDEKNSNNIKWNEEQYKLTNDWKGLLGLWETYNMGSYNDFLLSTYGEIINKLTLYNKIKSGKWQFSKYEETEEFKNLTRDMQNKANVRYEILRKEQHNG